MILKIDVDRWYNDQTGWLFERTGEELHAYAPNAEQGTPGWTLYGYPATAYVAWLNSQMAIDVPAWYSVQAQLAQLRTNAVPVGHAIYAEHGPDYPIMQWEDWDAAAVAVAAVGLNVTTTYQMAWMDAVRRAFLDAANPGEGLVPPA